MKEQPYSVFADFYDRMTVDVGYSARAAYIRSIFGRMGFEPRILLDLACGTGSMALEMAKAGYEVIGVDASEQMLSKAAQKTAADYDILYLCQDMCRLDLYGTVDAVICCLDSLNHLGTSSKMLEAFRRVSLFLNPGGLFVFDMNTPYKLASILQNNTFVYDYGYDDLYCVWQNTYLQRIKTCRFDLTFFVPRHGRYERYDEHFSEKAYSSAQISKMLQNAGMVLADEFEELTFDRPGEQAQRIYYVAQKRGL